MIRRQAALAAILLAALAGCDRRNAPPIVDGVRQTGLPGHVTAGGGTSGAVLATAPAKPADRGPAGTPGIPLGSEGNTAGTELGAAVAPSPPAMTEADREQRALLATMEAVALRWRTRAAAQGQPVHAATPADMPATPTQAAPSGQPEGRLTAAGASLPIASEKRGTAAPSPDVKQAVKPPPDPGVNARAPKAAN
jgi:colicin import membrane protein